MTSTILYYLFSWWAGSVASCFLGCSNSLLTSVIEFLACLTMDFVDVAWWFLYCYHFVIAYCINLGVCYLARQNRFDDHQWVVVNHSAYGYLQQYWMSDYLATSSDTVPWDSFGFSSTSCFDYTPNGGDCSFFIHYYYSAAIKSMVTCSNWDPIGLKNS